MARVLCLWGLVITEKGEMTMRKEMIVATIFFLAVGFCGLWGVEAQEDVLKHPSCKFCGMDRSKFSKTRMLIEYDDGTSVGTCSIHCAAVELAVTIDKIPRKIMVADYETGQLLDAERAFWVIGGDIPGVMTRRGKWAFQDRERAEGFVRGHGGVVVDFEAAMRASYEDMYEDTKAIRERRKARSHKH